MTNIAKTITLLTITTMVATAANLNLLHPNIDLALPDNLPTKTELCNHLKQINMEKISLIYIQSTPNPQNKDLFLKQVKEGEDCGVKYNKRDYLFDTQQLDEQSFLVCMKTLRSSSLKLESFSQDNLEAAFIGLNNSEEVVILIYDENDDNQFFFEERILASETDKEIAVDGNGTNSEVDKDVNTEVAEDKNKKDKPVGAGKNKINIGPSGLLGVGVMVIFILVLFVFFNLLADTGDFNVKFVKEKMPLGKEY